MEVERRLLRVSELASRLGVSSWVVRHWTRSEGLPCLRVNSRVVRYEWERVLAWLRDRSEGG